MNILLFTLAVLSLLSPATSVRIDRAATNYMRPLLKSIGGSARINYAGICPGERKLLFPQVDVQPAPDGTTGITAVRQMFRNDSQVTVVQDPSGMVRITVGSVSTSTLQTKIPVLTLDSDSQYTPQLADFMIANALKTYAVEHLDWPLSTMDIIAQPPVEGLPHLPPLMQNVTVDEALDSVARTFKGIVLYGECKQPDGKELFAVDYIDGP